MNKTVSLELKMYDGDNLYGHTLLSVNLKSLTPLQMRLALLHIAEIAARESQPRDKKGRFIAKEEL